MAEQFDVPRGVFAAADEQMYIAKKNGKTVAHSKRWEG
jgi:hypothetical protein